MEEIWKGIPNYENYKVSNYGRVKSLPKPCKNNAISKEKILKNISGKKGYLYVNLYKNKKSRHYYIHCLVAEAFLDKKHFKSMPDEDRSFINLNDLEINHKDENKENNNVLNLEYCTHYYNMNFNNLNERIKNTQTIRYARKINQYDLEGNFIKTWDSIREIERELNIFHQNIINCCKKKYKTAGGYIWKYADEYNVANAILGGI